jgi:predicted RNase H-like nuclease (RuvC/YqgF family)
MGVDIKPGYSPRSRRTPRYFVVVIRNSEVVAKYDDVPLYRLIRLIIEHHVDVLAVDNLYELTGSVRGLVKLSKLIPPWCKIVEVTWTPEGYKSTEVLAKEHGLPKPTDPESTAFLNAILAEKGFGREIKLHVDRVYVVVSKGRTPHQGGASSDRFKRGIRASVLQVVKENQGDPRREQTRLRPRGERKRRGLRERLLHHLRANRESTGNSPIYST